MTAPALIEGRGRSGGSRAALDLDIGDAAELPAAVETSWKPQAFQERVLACLHGVTFAVGGVGSGKSEAGALLVLKWALRHPRRKDGTPTSWMVVGPEFNLIRSAQFAKILNHARRLRSLGYGGVVRRVVTGQNPRIELFNGVTLVGMSGDQYARMEGVEVDGVWQDEAQRQPEEAFQTAIQRMRSADEVRCIVTASPEDTPGWLWAVISGDRRYSELREALLRSGHGRGLRVFRWTSRANAANEGDVLDVIGAVLRAKGEQKASQKLEGRFPGTTEAPSLTVISYARAFVDKLSLQGEEARPHVLGIDIGESQDFTWLTVLSTRGVVLWMERFNAGSPGVPRATFFPWLEAHVQEVAALWRVKKIVIDTAKAGKPVAQRLEQVLGGLSGRIKVEGVDTSIHGRKSECIESLNLANAAGRVRIPRSWIAGGNPEQTVPEVDQLRKEFEELIPVERDGKRRFDHPQGGHDDGIISLALAWRGLSQDAATTTRVPSSWGTINLESRRFQ